MKNKFVLKIIKSFCYSTLINMIPVLVEYFNSSIIFLGISNELKLQLTESVRSQINLLFLKTISSGLDSNRLSLPDSVIIKLYVSTINSISITESFFFIFSFISGDKSLHDLFAFIPIIQSPFKVNSLSFVISIVLECSDWTLGCP